MRLIDADGVIEEILKNKLMAREPAAERCMEIIKNATTYVEPPEKCEEWIIDKNPEEEGKYWITTDTVQRGIVESGIGSWDGFSWDTFANVYAWKPMVLPVPYED